MRYRSRDVEGLSVSLDKAQWLQTTDLRRMILSHIVHLSTNMNLVTYKSQILIDTNTVFYTFEVTGKLPLYR
jgi:hypothetical protein